MAGNWSISNTRKIEYTKIKEAILYCLTSQNRQRSESTIKLASIMPSEREGDEIKCLSRLVQTNETQSLL